MGFLEYSNRAPGVVRSLWVWVSISLLGHQTLAYALVSAVTWGSLASAPVAADPFDEAAVKGQSFGRSLIAGPSTDGQRIRFEGASGMESVEVVELFQSLGRAEETTDLEGAFGDDTATDALAATLASRLKTEDSAPGEAYRLVRETALHTGHPDLFDEPIFRASKTILDGDDPVFESFFTGCTRTAVTSGSKVSVHVPDYKTCERLHRPSSGTCTIHHALSTSGKLGQVFVGALGVSVNTFQFDLKNGTWQSIAPSDGAQFAGELPFTIDAAEVCDGQHHYRYVGAWDWPSAPVPGEFDSSVCYTVVQHPTCTNDLIGRVELRDNCSSGDTWFKYAAEFNFAWVKLTADRWSTPDCVDRARGIDDGACKGSYRCTTGPDSAGCIDIGGFKLCHGEAVTEAISKPPVAGLDKLCLAAEVTADCGFNVGQLDCWTDVQGNRQCPFSDGTRVDTCTALASDPACAFVRSECIAGLEGDSGKCYAFSETWDCGDEVEVPRERTTEILQCGGPIRCMGESCVRAPREANPDFTRAASALQAVNFTAMDLSCEAAATPGGPHDGRETGCRVFKGEGMECKKALGGWVDCCETPAGIRLADYLKMTMASWDLAQKLELGEALAAKGLDVPGAWKAMQGWTSSTFASVTQPLTSAWGELVQGVTAEPVATLENVSLESLKAELTQATGQFVVDLFGEEVAQLFFSQATNSAGETVYELGGSMGTALSAIMYAYMVYTVLNILVHIIWECEAAEFQLGAKRELKSCQPVGSYCANDSLFGCIEKRESFCCYHSPFARIVQAGAREQLGLGFGRADRPMCEGLTLAQFAEIDWTRIDLDEWFGILASTGVLPSAGDYDVTYSLANATTSRYATVPTPNALERVEQRVDEAQFDAARNKIRNDLWSGIR